MSYEENLSKISVEHWDDGDYVIIYNNVVLGPALSVREANEIRNWLAGALPDLKRAILK